MATDDRDLRTVTPIPAGDVDAWRAEQEANPEVFAVCYFPGQPITPEQVRELLGDPGVFGS